MMLDSLILALHVVICVLVIGVVLLQSGKGAGFAGLVGGGGSDALFSAPSGTSFIKKLTTGLAIAFFSTSLLLTILAARRGVRSVTQTLQLPPVSAPATPATETAPSPTAPAAPQKK